jgi:hypothetical protein
VGTPTSSSTAAPGAPGGTASPANAPITGLSVQLADADLVVTLDQHLTALDSHLTGARFLSPTRFTITLVGLPVRGNGPVTTTAASGLVREVTVALDGSDVVLTADLRSPASQDQVAVGGGNEFQIAFSQ